MKVLIISDDEPGIKDIVFCLQVRYPDVEILTFDDDRSGIDRLKSEPQDLVILDSTLPKSSAISVIEQIRGFSDIAIMVLAVDGPYIERAMEMVVGSDDYIIKPIIPLQFLVKVKTLVGASKEPIKT